MKIVLGCELLKFCDWYPWGFCLFCILVYFIECANSFCLTVYESWPWWILLSSCTLPVFQFHGPWFESHLAQGLVEWLINFLTPIYDTLNLPTVWSFNVIHCGFECKINYASLQLGTHLYCTQSTLVLTDHSRSSTVIRSNKLHNMPACDRYHVVNVSIQYTVNPPIIWPFNILHCGLKL